MSIRWRRVTSGEYVSADRRFTIVKDPTPWGYTSWELYDETVEPLPEGDRYNARLADPKRIYNRPFATYREAKEAAQAYLDDKEHKDG